MPWRELPQSETFKFLICPAYQFFPSWVKSLVLHLRSHWHIQGHLGFSDVIFQDFFSFAFYIYIYDIHSWYPFGCVWIHSFFLACGSLFVPAPFVEESVFAPLSYLCWYVEDWLSIFRWVAFWAVLFCCMDLFVYSFTTTILSSYHSLVVSLEVEQYWLSHLVFLLSYCCLLWVFYLSV